MGVAHEFHHIDASEGMLLNTSKEAFRHFSHADKTPVETLRAPPAMQHVLCLSPSRTAVGNYPIFEARFRDLTKVEQLDSMADEPSWKHDPSKKAYALNGLPAAPRHDASGRRVAGPGAGAPPDAAGGTDATMVFDPHSGALTYDDCEVGDVLSFAHTTAHLFKEYDAETALREHGDRLGLDATDFERLAVYPSHVPVQLFSCHVPGAELVAIMTGEQGSRWAHPYTGNVIGTNNRAAQTSDGTVPEFAAGMINTLSF
jgi:hypothetical protein